MKRAVVLLLAACTVPDLSAFGKKACDFDGGHPCIDGYVCSAGFCEMAMGGPCTGAQTQSCGVTKGECHAGMQKCTNGMFGVCEGSIGPTDEICDGKDNDCDGDTDEGLFNATPCEKTAGICASRFHACVNGAYETTCTAASYGADYQSVESLCDNKDNDCNGSTDEAGAGECPDAGVCAGGMLACTNGTPGACTAPGYEATEASCDGRDNDCDGLVDEGLVSATACSKQQGVCATKHAACVDGGFESTCTSASYGPTYEASESKCDGLDNDCDGFVDRAPGNLPLISSALCELQVGVCAGAFRVCADGGLETPCGAASYGSSYEALEVTCDTLDNDCDGLPDRSGDRLLIGGANAQSHLAWTAADADQTIVWQENTGVMFRHGTHAVQLAANGTNPVLAKLANGNYVVAYTTTGGLTLVGVTPSGSIQWTSPASTQGVFGSPRIAATGNTAGVVWIDPNAGLLGATVNATGGVTPSVSSLTPDAGAAQILFADIAARASGFYVGWASNQSSAWYAKFRDFDSQLGAPGGVAAFTNSNEIVTEVAVSATSSAWLGVNGSNNFIRYHLADGGTPIFGAPVNAPSGLSVADGVVFWTDGTHLFGRFETGNQFDITPPTGMSLGATRAVPEGGAVLVGYEIDKGAGNGIDLDFQSICPR